MRKYTPKGSVQKRAKYNDRFWVAPPVPREQVKDDSFFAEVLETVSSEVEILDSYVEIKQLVIHIKPEDNLKTLKSLKEKSCFEMCSGLSGC